MKHPQNIFTFLLLLLSLGSFNCNATLYRERGKDYRAELRRVQNKLRANPGDEQALQEFGVLLFKTQQYTTAFKVLSKINERTPQNGRTLFYLGMTLEALNKLDAAHKVYGNFSTVARSDEFRKLLQGRYHKLTRDLVRQDIRTLVEKEKRLVAQKGGAVGDMPVSSNTVAVFPLFYYGTDEKYAALGHGLSEMILIDLGKVSSLRVVERIRLEELLRELDLTRSNLFDKRTLPRYGRILGAGRFISGAYTVTGGKRLRLDITSWDFVKQAFPAPRARQDVLRNLYYLQKDIVFELIEDLGVELTGVEREQIQRIPTKNLQALLAFSRGLELEEAGRFVAAARLYQQAAKLDPDFELASQKAEAAESLSVAGSSRADAIAKADEIERGGGDAKVDLLGNRLQTLGASVGSNFVPGQDNREIGELLETPIPDPPPPPPPAPDDQ
ncbi:MAG: CsgG/HfaB family protein [bacterium]